MVLIGATDIVPSVEGAVAFSTRPADMLGAAGGDGARIQNRAARSADRVADATARVPLDGSFGRVGRSRCASLYLVACDLQLVALHLATCHL